MIMANKIYAIRESVSYGEYVYIVCAKSKIQALKMIKRNSYKSNIVEVKLLKTSKVQKILFYGGSKE